MPELGTIDGRGPILIVPARTASTGHRHVIVPLYHKYPLSQQSQGDSASVSSLPLSVAPMTPLQPAWSHHLPPIAHSRSGAEERRRLPTPVRRFIDEQS